MENIGKLELEMMKVIGRAPKTIQIPIGNDKYQLGANLYFVKEQLISQDYSQDDIHIALNTLRELKYVVELNGTRDLNCIAVKPRIVERFGIPYSQLKW